MAREFSVVGAIARREVESHQKQFVGITASAPRFVDENGLLEWVVDVRVGVVEGWGLIQNCLISQWALGVVTDMNVPVRCERSTEGLVTVIGRSQVRLPDINFHTYSYFELGLTFMADRVQDDDSAGVWRDGFGHEMADPESEAGDESVWTWDQSVIEWGDPDFEYGETPLEAVDAGWQEA